MRTTPHDLAEKGRVQRGAFATPRGANFGAFCIRSPADRGALQIIASDGSPDIPWEHVSVSRTDRCPTWEEMCHVKRMFWNDDECVVQFHPPTSEHVNNHNYCLHLWKPLGVTIPTPPAIAVGIASLGRLV